MQKLKKNILSDCEFLCNTNGCKTDLNPVFVYLCMYLCFHLSVLQKDIKVVNGKPNWYDNFNWLIFYFSAEN